MIESEGKFVVLFDGDCGLCNRSVQFILKYERKQKLKFASLQSSFSKKIFKEFNLKDDFNQSVLFYCDSILFSKSNAILRLIPFLKWYFFPAFILWLIPKFIRDFLYDKIARNRKHIFKDCRIMNTKEGNRMLD